MSRPRLRARSAIARAASGLRLGCRGPTGTCYRSGWWHQEFLPVHQGNGIPTARVGVQGAVSDNAFSTASPEVKVSAVELRVRRCATPGEAAPLCRHVSVGPRFFPVDRDSAAAPMRWSDPHGEQSTSRSAAAVPRDHETDDALGYVAWWPERLSQVLLVIPVSASDFIVRSVSGSGSPRKRCRMPFSTKSSLPVKLRDLGVTSFSRPDTEDTSNDNRRSEALFRMKYRRHYPDGHFVSLVAARAWWVDAFVA